MNSPRLSLADANGNGTSTVTLVSGDAVIPAGDWVTITLPFDEMFGLVQGTADSGFTVRDTARVTFVQGLDDGKAHTLLIDDIRVRDAAANDSTPPPAPAGLEVKAYERHFDLAWQASKADDLLEYRIHRSTDGKNFEPVGVQQENRSRYVDFTGPPGTESRVSRHGARPRGERVAAVAGFEAGRHPRVQRR